MRRAPGLLEKNESPLNSDPSPTTAKRGLKAVRKSYTMFPRDSEYFDDDDVRRALTYSPLITFMIFASEKFSSFRKSLRQIFIF